jgi:hypothetical protein
LAVDGRSGNRRRDQRPQRRDMLPKMMKTHREEDIRTISQAMRRKMAGKQNENVRVLPLRKPMVDMTNRVTDEPVDSV